MISLISRASSATRIASRAAMLIATVALGAGMPARAAAQAGIPGGEGRSGFRGSFNMKRTSGLDVPTIVQPLNLLIMHRQDLALTDSQFAHVIQLKRGLDSLDGPLMRKLDSVQRLFKGGIPVFSTPSAARRDSLAEAHRLIDAVVGEIRDNVSTARDRAYDLLSSRQRTDAERFEADEEKRVADEQKAAKQP